MNRHGRMMLILLYSLVPLFSWGGAHSFAQDIVLDEEAAFEQAAQAVVRIRICVAEVCEIGSGVIIDPGGIILTAWHVVAREPENLASDLYQNIEIQMSEDSARPPATRFRAQVIASKPEQDLALLRVTYDLLAGRNIVLGASLNLPFLGLSNQTPRTANLRVMGYPPLNDTLSYPIFEQSGLDENGALLRVQNPLNRGFSGGPALMRREGGPYEIVGLVIRRREEVGLIRSVRQLQNLKWQRGAQQAWADTLEIAKLTGADGMERVRIRFDFHALDLAGRRLQVRVFLFDVATNQPWTPAVASLPANERGQVYLTKSLAVQHVAEWQRAVTLEAAASELGGDPEQFLFRVSLWAEDGSRSFWQSVQSYTAEPVAEEVAMVAPTTTSNTHTPTPSSAVTATITPDHTGTAQARQNEVQAAVDATMTALAPTATPTPDFDQLLATAVAATLTAQPSPVQATATLTRRNPIPATPTVANAADSVFVTVSLAEVANNSTTEGYVNSPSGDVVLGGVPFFIPGGLNSVTTQAESAPQFPHDIDLAGLDIPRPRRIYLLLTGGAVRQEFAGNTIGAIDLLFTNDGRVTVDLVAGENIREWKDCCNPNIITLADRTVRTVWRGKNKFDAGNAFIDMLVIEIPVRHQQETLRLIRISDLSDKGVLSLNPALNLIGVTVEHDE
jgi:hypothetical protein